MRESNIAYPRHIFYLVYTKKHVFISPKPKVSSSRLFTFHVVCVQAEESSEKIKHAHTLMRIVGLFLLQMLMPLEETKSLRS